MGLCLSPTKRIGRHRKTEEKRDPAIMADHVHRNGSAPGETVEIRRWQTKAAPVNRPDTEEVRGTVNLWDEHELRTRRSVRQDEAPGEVECVREKELATS